MNTRFLFKMDSKMARLLGAFSVVLLSMGCNQSKVPIEVVIEGTVIYPSADNSAGDSSKENTSHSAVGSFQRRYDNHVLDNAVICGRVFYFSTASSSNSSTELIFEKCEKIELQSNGTTFVNRLTMVLPGDLKDVSRVEAAFHYMKDHQAYPIPTELVEFKPEGLGKYKGVVVIRL